MRTVEQLESSALEVLDRAYYKHGAYKMAPLFSGGHDSLCACYLASQHRGFAGVVHHIDTGIGARYTREFVERVCSKFGWQLKVWKSLDTYEKLIRGFGFPGPGAHYLSYIMLKERCVVSITKGKNKVMLVNGARSQESTRRMGNVAAIQVGDVRTNKKTGETRRINLKRIWTAPCHDWSKAEQQHYMDECGLPINKLKLALGMSGECFCGAFASPGELDRIRQFAPDVAAEIDRLAAIAAQHGKPCRWGERPAGKIEVAETGPLCTSCDYRASAGGFVIP